MDKNKVEPLPLGPEGLMLDKISEVIERNEHRNLSQVEINLINVCVVYLSFKLSVPIERIQSGTSPEAHLLRQLLAKLLLENTKMQTALIASVIGQTKANMEALKEKVEEQHLRDRIFKKQYEELISKMIRSPEVMNNSRDSYYDKFVSRKICEHLNRVRSE